MGLHVERPAVRVCMTVMNTASLLRKVRQMGRFLVDFVPVQSKFVADPIPKWQGQFATFDSTRSRA
jgi:hypothetical protein